MKIASTYDAFCLQISAHEPNRPLNGRTEAHTDSKIMTIKTSKPILNVKIPIVH